VQPGRRSSGGGSSRPSSRASTSGGPRATTRSTTRCVPLKLPLSPCRTLELTVSPTRCSQEVHPDILETMVDFLSSGASAGAPGVSTRTYYWGDISKAPSEWESLRTREEGRLISGGASRSPHLTPSLSVHPLTVFGSTQEQPGCGHGASRPSNLLLLLLDIAAESPFAHRQACIALSNHLIAAPHVLERSTRIIELGAGVGLLSLVAARLWRTAGRRGQVVATDVDEKVLDVLTSNLELSASPFIFISLTHSTCTH